MSIQSLYMYVGLVDAGGMWHAHALHAGLSSKFARMPGQRGMSAAIRYRYRDFFPGSLYSDEVCTVTVWWMSVLGFRIFFVQIAIKGANCTGI